MRLNLKPILTIVAIFLIMLLLVFIIWSINQSLNLGIWAGHEFLVAVVILGLLLLLFPVILIVSVYRCSNLFMLGAIWSITIFLYVLMPLKTYIDYKESRMALAVRMELTDRIDDPSTSWETFKTTIDKAEEKTDETKSTIMAQLLNK